MPLTELSSNTLSQATLASASTSRVSSRGSGPHLAQGWHTTGVVDDRVKDEG